MSADKPEQQITQVDKDGADTGRKLLDDAQKGHWLSGADKQTMEKLHQAGVLPDVALFDAKAVKDHLAADLKAQSGAEAELYALRRQNDVAARHLEQSPKEDQAVKHDFDTVLKGYHDAFHGRPDPNPNRLSLTHEDIQALAKSKDASPDVKAAAQRLIDNWDANKDFTSASAPRNSNEGMSDAGGRHTMSAMSVDRGLKSHEAARAQEKTDLAHSGDRQKELEAKKAALDDLVSTEKQAVSMRKGLDDLTKVPNGQGYDAVARHLLALDGGKHSEQEVRALRKILRDQFIEDHPGRDANNLTHKDKLVTADNIDKIMAKMHDVTGKKA